MHGWTPLIKNIDVWIKNGHAYSNISVGYVSSLAYKPLLFLCRLVLDEVSRKPTCSCPFFSAKHTDGKCYQVRASIQTQSIREKVGGGRTLVPGRALALEEVLMSS